MLKNIEKFQPYLGKRTVIFPDHNPLRFFENMKTKNAKLSRWSVIMQDKPELDITCALIYLGDRERKLGEKLCDISSICNE